MDVCCAGIDACADVDNDGAIGAAACDAGLSFTGEDECVTPKVTTRGAWVGALVGGVVPHWLRCWGGMGAVGWGAA